MLAGDAPFQTNLPAPSIQPPPGWTYGKALTQTGKQPGWTCEKDVDMLSLPAMNRTHPESDHTTALPQIPAPFVVQVFRCQLPPPPPQT